MRAPLLVFFVLLCPVLTAESPFNRPLVGPELSHVELTAGTRFQLLARYQSILGRALKIATSEMPIAIPDGEFPILRSPNLRSRCLLLDLEVVVEAGETRLSLVKADAGPNPTQFFRDIDLDPLLPARRLAIAAWAIDTGEAIEASPLAQAGRERLLATFKGTARAPSARDDLTWLDLGHRSLANDDGWHTLVIDFAARNGDVADLDRKLRELGYIQERSGWRVRSQRLAEIGMRDVDGKPQTLERLQLEKALANWAGRRRSSRLLRAHTAQRYATIAEEQQVTSGMNRRELITAWGYPKSVTWIRRKGAYYEAWSYKGRYACLADGLVFFYEE